VFYYRGKFYISRWNVYLERIVLNDNCDVDVGEGSVVDCLNENYGCHEWNSSTPIYNYYVSVFDHGQSTFFTQLLLISIRSCLLNL
jgi:hypothetical protein